MTRSPVERARDAYERRAWGEAEAAFAAADAGEPLVVADLDRWATVAYMRGSDDTYFERLGRAYDATDPADVRGAARRAFWIGIMRLQRGEPAAAGGWLARAERLVGGMDCAEAAYLRVPEMFRRYGRHDLVGAVQIAGELVARAARYGDRDLFTLTLHNQGHFLVALGQVEEGLRLLDEAMLEVVAGRTSPIATGIVYCGVILGCQAACDVARAREWTAALSAWCDGQTDLLAFTGRCLVHRAELHELRGEWDAALAEARRAAQRCSATHDPRVTALAEYRRGEIHRLRGETADAEAAYRAAASGGCEPQPGLALLRAAAGDRSAAAAMLRRALAETPEAHERATLLPAALEVQLAEGDPDAAAATCRALDDIARHLGTDLVAARAAHARGMLALAAGEPERALAELRRAGELWRTLEAPYETARVRELIGRACRSLGDQETAANELAGAADGFRGLGAQPDAARVEDVLRGSGARHGLTARELEILRLVAAGSTNKAIARALVLSERTVDRHVSNILAKLRVTSRAGATAYAYEHHLLTR